MEFLRHPAAERPRAALLVAFLLLALLPLLWRATAPLTALALELALWGSLHDFWLPRRYRLGEEGLTIDFLGWRQTLPWSRFRSVHPDRNGLLLSPFPQRHALEGFRGQFLPLVRGDRTAALAYLRERL